MKKFIKFIALGVAFASTLSGCSSSNAPKTTGSETSSNTNQPQQVTYEINKGTKPKDPMVLDYIQKKFGISFNFIEIADANAIKTKLAAGDVPDILGLVKTEIMSLDVPNLFLPVSDYYDKLPEYKKYLDQDQDKNNVNVLNADGTKGKAYYLNYYRKNPDVDYTVPFVREDVFKKTGLKELPKNYDELYTMLKKLKELDPKSYPWTERDGTKKLFISNAFPFGTGYNNSTAGMYFEPLADGGKGNWVFSPTKPEFRNMLIYFAKLYKEGLLDPDYVTQKRDGMDQKYSTGRSTFFFENAGFLNNYETALNKTIPDAKFVVVPLLDNQVHQPRAVKGTYPYSSQGVAIKKDVKNLDILLQYINWSYSDEGIMTTNWGVEGKSYTLVNGKPQYIPAYADQFKSDANPVNSLLKSFGAGLGSMPFYLDDDNLNYFRTKNHLDRSNLVSAEKGLVFDRIAPSFKPDEKEKVDNYVLSISPIILTAAEQTITGQITIDGYDKVVKQVIDMGANDLEAIYQKAYARSK